MASLPYILRFTFCKNTYSIEIKMFLNLTKIFLESQQKFTKDGKTGFFIKIIYFAVFLFKVSAWLFNYAVCKIWLIFYAYF